jgi:hypothetical protein
MEAELPPQLDLADLVDGPFLVTFTAHLPFPVGIPNDLGHTISFDAPFRDPAATAQFGERPFVNIRVFEIAESGLPSWRKGTHAAIEWFYGVRLDDDPDQRYGEDSFLSRDQWVTLETPHAVVDGEDAATDRGFTFHRCLNTFNYFLQATLILTRDIRIRTISSHDLRPVVLIGAIPLGQPWRLLSTMYMHPEAHDKSVLTVDRPFTQDQLNEGLHAIATHRPYMTTMVWRSRAQRALRQTGDASDSIVSFQVAAESLLFDTYRMLLIDEGLSSTELATELDRDVPFKSLLTRILPRKLGGQWDTTRAGSAVSEYWAKLYLVRNSIIHTGMQPHGGHANDAQRAYWGLRDHLEERLWAKHAIYPRTVLVRIGKEGLETRGWLTARMRCFIEQIEKESGPWYWPHDLAGRPK